jgi:DNA-binding response OmpR family regulator
MSEFKKTRILLVDDEDTILFAFKRVLSEPDCEIHTASSLEEAVSLLNNNQYNALLADLRLSSTPIKDGLGVIQVARKTQLACKIFVLTAYGDEETKKIVYDLGTDLYMEKPVSPQKVKATFKQMGIY